MTPEEKLKDDQRLLKCATDVGELAVKFAFQKSTFVYGTMGKGSSALKALKKWAASPSRLRPGQQVIARELNLFDPGTRIITYNQGDDNTQMMDMYYGQKDNALYLRRNPAIAEFVHKAMDFKGPFSMKQSGRDAYMKSYNTSAEGWWSTSPKVRGNTATVEMSRVIRWGIHRFGGKLTFEGKEIYYSQVFNMNPNSYKGDTDREAISLFEYFNTASSFETPFGKGKLIFMWNGVPTIPTHCHFLSNWGFDAAPDGRKGSAMQAVVVKLQRLPGKGGADFSQFHKSSQKKPDDIGALHHHALNTGNIADWLKKQNVTLNEPLWAKFREKPAALQSMSTDEIIELIQHGG